MAGKGNAKEVERTLNVSKGNPFRKDRSREDPRLHRTGGIQSCFCPSCQFSSGIFLSAPFARRNNNLTRPFARPNFDRINARRDEHPPLFFIPSLSSSTKEQSLVKAEITAKGRETKFFATRGERRSRGKPTTLLLPSFTPVAEQRKPLAGVGERVCEVERWTGGEVVGA